jgi:hypothetical protein
MQRLGDFAGTTNPSRYCCSQLSLLVSPRFP